MISQFVSGKFCDLSHICPAQHASACDHTLAAAFTGVPQSREHHCRQCNPGKCISIRGNVFHPCKLPTPVHDAPTVSLNAQLSLIQICAREFNSMTGYMQLASMSLRPSISTRVYPYQLLFRALESNCITSQNHWLWSATACMHMCM